MAEVEAPIDSTAPSPIDRRGRSAIRAVWPQLHPLMPKGSRRFATELVLASFVAGVLEAAILVLIVSSALVLTGADSTLSLPILGSVDVSLGAAMAIAATAGIVMLGLHLRVAHISASLAGAVLHAARDRAMRAYSRASWARQSLDREGAMQETISSLAIQSSTIVIHLGQLAVASIGLAVLLTAGMLVDAAVTGVVLAFGALLFVALRPVGRLTRRSAQEFVDRNADFAEQITQWSSLAMDLRVFGVEGAELDRLASESENAAQALARSRFIAVAGADGYRDIAVLFLIGAVAGLSLVNDSALAGIGAVVLLVIRSLSYAQMTHTARQRILELSPNVELLMTRIESLDQAAEHFGATRFDTVGEITLDDVGYSYGPGHTALAEVTMTIGAGEAIGVIGHSGGGKSTLVQILLRLRTPTEGTVLVSGVPYDEIDSASWQRLVALVSQEPRLFQGTVEENIVFLRTDISHDQVVQAARDAHVLDDIEALPDGFATQLGPRGAGLSGGQKQRVAIARALVGSPALLVLDEPTSALDVRSEELLKRTVEELKGNVTLVIIAHRLTTLACCDRVVALERGRVQTIGTLQEAVARSSFKDEVGII